MSETLNLKNNETQLLNSEEPKKTKVDINVLKARAQAVQNKEYRKNTFFLILIVVILGFLGIYFST